MNDGPQHKPNKSSRKLATEVCKLGWFEHGWLFFSIEDLGGPKGSPNMYICMYIYLGWTKRPMQYFNTQEVLCELT